MITEKTIDMLTKDSVSILTKNFIEDNGEKLQAGENHRCAYVNSVFGRDEIVAKEPEDISSTVLNYWGDEPTIIDIVFENTELAEDEIEQ